MINLFILCKTAVATGEQSVCLQLIPGVNPRADNTAHMVFDYSYCVPRSLESGLSGFSPIMLIAHGILLHRCGLYEERTEVISGSVTPGERVWSWVTL